MKNIGEMKSASKTMIPQEYVWKMLIILDFQQTITINLIKEKMADKEGNRCCLLDRAWRSLAQDKKEIKCKQK